MKLKNWELQLIPITFFLFTKRMSVPLDTKEDMIALAHALEDQFPLILKLELKK